MGEPVTTKFQGWNITMTPDPEGKWSWTAERKGGKELAAQHPGTPSFDTKYQALDDAKAQLGKGKA
jgi:hypothetical protein